jgi:hypothetical protein
LLTRVSAFVKWNYPFLSLRHKTVLYHIENFFSSTFFLAFFALIVETEKHFSQYFGYIYICDSSGMGFIIDFENPPFDVGVSVNQIGELVEKTALTVDVH